MLNLYDIIVSSVIMACFFSGLYKGAVRLMLANISFVLSVLFSFVLFPAAQMAVGEYIESSVIANAVASCLAYIISLIICAVFFSKIKLVIKPLCGGMVDKTVGSMLGIVNGLLLSLLVFLVAAVVSSPKPLHFNDSFYALFQVAKHDQYPRWLKSSNSFPVMNKFFNEALENPHIADLLKKIDLGSNHIQNKNEDKPLNLELDNLLENE